jgi:hypothetical protein
MSKPKIPAGVAEAPPTTSPAIERAKQIHQEQMEAAQQVGRHAFCEAIDQAVLGVIIEDAEPETNSAETLPDLSIAVQEDPAPSEQPAPDQVIPAPVAESAPAQQPAPEPRLTVENCRWFIAPNGRIVKANEWHRRSGHMKGFFPSHPPQ